MFLLLHLYLMATATTTLANPPPHYWEPKIHNTPACLNAPGGNSHDIAAAITHRGTHHVFQLCGNGWHHSTSSDLVHWMQRGVGLNEWPSGFVVIDEDDPSLLCAGFREAQPSDQDDEKDLELDHVSIVLRCASQNDTSSSSPMIWSPPEIIFNVSFWRFLPYDPFRPFQDKDGRWYAGIAVDACNSTRLLDVGCKAGGQIDLWSSGRLRAHSAFDAGTNTTTITNWTRIQTPMFTTNKTLFGPSRLIDGEQHEFVTVDLIGNLPTSSFSSSSTSTSTQQGVSTKRVFLNNPYYARGSTQYYIGSQSNGSIFTPTSTSMLDWGEFGLNTGDDTNSSRGLNAINCTSKNNPSGGKICFAFFFFTFSTTFPQPDTTSFLVYF